MTLLTPTEEAAKQKKTQHDHWQAAAGGYSKWVIEHHMVQGIYEHFATTLAEILGGKGVVQVLDVASAAGEPAVSVARALPMARVLSTDLAEEYQHLGREHAARCGVEGRVEFQTADAEDLHQFGDASFEAITCSLGLMFMPQYPNALEEFMRVLKPGGVLAVAVWQSLEKWPFLHTIQSFCSELDPSATAPSSLATRFGDDPVELLDALRGAGFADISRQDLEASFRLPAGLWWQAMLEMPTPLGRILGGMKEQEVEEAREKLAARFAHAGFFRPGGDLCVTNNYCHFITARKE